MSENDYVTAVSKIYKLENQEETCMEIKFYLVQCDQSQLILMKAKLYGLLVATFY